MKNLTKIGSIFLVLVALALLAGTTLTFAQDDPAPDVTTPESDSEDGSSAESSQFGDRGNHAHPHIIDREAVKTAVSDTLGLTIEEIREMKAEGLTFEEIAAAQGVSLEDVEAAVQAVVTEAVENAVAEGTITQEQADLMLERAGTFGRHGRSFGGAKPFGRGSGNLLGDLDMNAVIADSLGITVDELEAFQADGLRLTDIADELGVEMSEVETAVQAAFEAAVGQAVEDGTLTQNQADQLLERGGRGFSRGGRGGFRGGPHGGFDNNPLGNGNAPAVDSSDA